MDNYLLARKEFKQFLVKDELHLIGLTSILMSSKSEDLVPIFMNEILNDAAHGKF